MKFIRMFIFILFNTLILVSFNFKLVNDRTIFENVALPLQIIGIHKNIINLMEAINELNHQNVKLLIFGSTNDDTNDDVLRLSKYANIKYISWINYNQFKNLLSFNAFV